MKHRPNHMIVAGILAGTVLEWYDFSLLGSLAPIISSVFFPMKSQTLSLLTTFGVFATGFIARPIGGLLFGHVGDRSGRRQTLSLTILLMALPTTLIGLLPSYNNAGIIAPLLLLVLRTMQGFASSGEYPGAICVLNEMAPNNKKSFYSSLSMLGVTGGIFLGSIINSLISSYLSQDQILTWGWRVPFILGLPLGLIGLLLRKKLHESNEFKNALKLKFPIKDIIQQNPVNLFKVTMLFSLSSISFYLGFVYISGYLVNAHQISLHQAMFNNAIATITMGLLIPVVGYISDYYDRKKIMLTGIAGLCIFFYPIFLLFTQGTASSLLLGQLALAFLLAIFTGPLAVTAAEAFTTSTRYTGIAVALNLGTSIFGGTCPFVATYLVQLTGTPVMPSYYLILVGFMCLLMLSQKNIKNNTSIHYYQSS